MNETTSGTERGTIEGTLPLYTQPELLTVKDHGDLGINTAAQSFDFVSAVKGVPLTAVELAAAQRNYPVVFSSLEQPALVAAVGVLEDRNLFVDEHGRWDESAYIPAYARCHPFAMVPRSDDQLMVVIDRAAPQIGENADQPFFDGSELTPDVQARVDFAVQFDAQVRITRDFCNKLAELGLLAGQEVTFTPQEGGEAQPLASYVAVNFDKLKELDAEILQQFHRDGTLAMIYAHRFSLDMWLYLLDRHNHLTAAD